ncbi:MAG TPA: T9SS type A sorting domain-containing protein, partial [Bacteroidia bacterium]|nr:T9SS type A sorting domain-containing protein [Bacteroidia bacterium]
TINRSTPVQVNTLTGITAVAGGAAHSLFLKNDNTVWACGRNWLGQLGDGTTTDRWSPVQVIGLCTVLGITESQQENNFQIFPNPTSGTFTIQSTNQQINKSIITITNVLGEKVYEQKIIEQVTEINLSLQANGIYFVRLRNNEQTVTRKIVINK